MHVLLFMQEAEMRRPEVKQIAAALRQLIPDQRESVTIELAALWHRRCLSWGAWHVARRAHTVSLNS
ncbi:MAG: hypothetical protein ABIR84_06215 [Candidatus Nitrotoga sp.]